MRNRDEIKNKCYDLLEETVSFFSRNDRAVVHKDGHPKPVYITPDGTNGCAIGRLMKIESEDDKKFLEENNNTPPNLLFRRIYENKRSHLIKEIEEYPFDFLMNLQGLHDDRRNWVENGLSKRGKEQYELLKQEISRK